MDNELEQLKKKAYELKREIDYYNALQLGFKIVLNGSYGAYASPYFIMFNHNVAGSITAQGRDVIQFMDRVNETFWYNLWHTLADVHEKLHIKDVKQIIKDGKKNNVSVYSDTDSIFVSFDPVIKNSTWKNIAFSELDSIDEPFIVLRGKKNIKPINPKCLGIFETVEQVKDFDCLMVVDGVWVKNRDFEKLVNKNVIWNWSYELDFIHGIDKIVLSDFFSDQLEEYAKRYGVKNIHDFELERISESMINTEKKKYIMHIAYEDGVNYKKLEHIYPKGVELIRSSTPLFARERIMDILKYLFNEPESFNIKELVKLVKGLKKEFDLCVPDRMDDIAMQSSCNKYGEKVIDDKKSIRFEKGTHFSVKAAAYYNFLLYKNKDLQSKYEYITSGSKIKYYYTKDKSVNKIFAYLREYYPIEYAPEIDLDVQFEKCILSPINSIILSLGMPMITKRLSVVLDIFGNN